jgi:enolase
MQKAYAEESVNAVIIKPNQIGTVTETLAAVHLARKYGWAVIASHRSGETNDDFIADFAYGVRADGLKLGAPARGERIAKYNRLLQIEMEQAKI